MPLHPGLTDVTQRIVIRSKDSRNAYLNKVAEAAKNGPRRAHLSCDNQAHAYAAMGASGNVHAAIQLSPEAADSGPIS